MPAALLISLKPRVEDPLCQFDQEKISQNQRGNREYFALSFPLEKAAQLGFGPVEHLFAAGGEVPAGAVDIEVKHRHRRAERVALAPAAFLCRAFER